MENQKMKQLEFLKRRKAKAELLPKSQLKKYARTYNEIILQISMLEEELGISGFKESNALKILFMAFKEINQQCTGINLEEFFKKHPDIDARLTCIERNIDKAFELKSTAAVKKAVDEYRNECLKIRKTAEDMTEIHDNEPWPFI